MADGEAIGGIPDSRRRNVQGAKSEEGPGAGDCICTFFSVIILILFFPLCICNCIKVINEYERAVILRMGKLRGGVRKAGLVFLLPCIDELKCVDIRSFVCQIQHQNILTRDSASVRVNAVVQARLLEKARSIMCIENAPALVRLQAASTLRNILAVHSLTDIISNTDTISKEIKKELARSTGGGLLLERVEIKDICLPEDMKRAMAAEAESARGARAKVIAAEGEKTASSFLKEASDSLGSSRVALNLRYLQTMKDMAALRESTILFPLPMNLGWRVDKRKQV